MNNKLKDSDLNKINGGCYKLYDNKTGELLNSYTFENNARNAIQNYLLKGVQVRVETTNFLDNDDLAGVYSETFGPGD